MVGDVILNTAARGRSFHQYKFLLSLHTPSIFTSSFHLFECSNFLYLMIDNLLFVESLSLGGIRMEENPRITITSAQGQEAVAVLVLLQSFIP